MEARSRRLVFQIHAWIGMNLGLLLFVVCFSGTIAVFSKELSWLVDPGLRVQPPPGREGKTLSWQDMYDRVTAVHPHAAIVALQPPAGDRSVAKAAILYGPDDQRLVLINPYTGAIQGHRSSFNLSSFFRIFHKQLYIVPVNLGFHGTLVVGVLAILLLVGAITGLLSIKRWWRAFLTLRQGRSPRLFWSDLHRLTGVWPLLVTLILSLTGIWYWAETILDSAGILAHDAPSAAREAASPQHRGTFVRPLDLDELIARAQSAYPSLTINQIRIPSRFGDPLVLSGQADAWLVRDRANRIEIDPYEGTILNIQKAEDLSLPQRLIDTADPLHFGDFGGLTSKIVWFVSGLALSAGILAGFYGACLRLRERHRLGFPSPQRWALAILPTAGLLVLSLYGTIAYGGVALLSAHQAIEATLMGRATLGPWQAMVYRYDTQGDTRLAILFEGDGSANFQTARLWLDSDPQARRDLPTHRLQDRLWTQVPPGALSCERPCTLGLELKAWTGETYSTSFPVVEASLRTALPQATGIPIGEKIVILIFAALLLASLCGWLGTLCYRTRSE